jgi:ABC-type multidrug transport system ATPase subunit
VQPQRVVLDSLSEIRLLAQSSLRYRRQILAIKHYFSRHDATVLLCTHDLAEAEALSERVGILDRGRLLALEPADALRARYGAETLEEAFFAATGRGFEDEIDEEDEREVYA